MEYLSPAPVPFTAFGVPPPPGFQLPSFSPLLFSPAATQQDQSTVEQQQQELQDKPHSTGPEQKDIMGNEQNPQKQVSFREFVTVAYTWGADEYDRSSTEVEPLTKNDLIELLLYRAEMQQYTRELLKLRKQAIEAERRKRQREIAAFQAYQRCSIAAAASAAAAQFAQPAYAPVWDHAAAVAAAAAASAAGPAYVPQQHYYMHQPLDMGFAPSNAPNYGSVMYY
ncbi:uncharacterized protein SPPG_05421 [Spizellomyces punctatus DAOM BR117]|uniref:Uncharacterized protein n=1 Tax=Spizellomyces punctatus (strain DAOM BR117) TaxID=645134 RepID=A0A0L0HDF8_SPIPD|nr:uncharacterized protein SPPG_05421 [Spizellomyces punctatus DAOM BR117]KNC99167.1 hypothetical protein SPPG_05421 [Spizellomyces punctatus DAOM BR117]|eukprot:XP_016607207.1 hypothetical protein SPPG_05421 [Spizellomyces punctatus DAOM BR117]